MFVWKVDREYGRKVKFGDCLESDQVGVGRAKVYVGKWVGRHGGR